MTKTKEKPRSIFDDYETSRELERDGAWVTTSKGYEFKIARIGGMNVEYSNYLIQQGKAIQTEIEELESRADEELNAENSKELEALADKMDNLMTEAFARHVVKGWRNLYDREGKEIPYTVENAIKLMEMRELRKELYPMAQEYATFLVSSLEKTAKN